MDNSNAVPEEWEAKLIDYTLGVMEPGDAASFEASLEECRKHVQFARQYSEVVGWLGAVVPPQEPPSGHKNRLMSRLASTPQTELTASSMRAETPASQPTLRVLPSLPAQEPYAGATAERTAQPATMTDIEAYREKRTNTGLLAALGAVAAAVILLVGFWGWNAQNDKQRAEQQVAQLQSQLNTLASRPNVPPGYKALSLPPQPNYSGVNALVLYNPGTTDAVFFANGLPQLPANQVYELWLLKAQGNPDKGGVFTADPTGSATHPTTSPQTLAQYTGFAVTIEPSPGVDVATGPAVVVGTYATP
ncbi:MAG: anti-sigma factor [Chloroflexota bacterium]